MYVERTSGIEIEIVPEYVAEHSHPAQGRYVFTYSVLIRNLGEAPARLLNRHWIITDGKGAVREVRGPGVVGETPRLEPGAEFRYASYCPLPTPTGNMRGVYEMERDDGSRFSVRIPLFFLRDLRPMH